MELSRRSFLKSAGVLAVAPLAVKVGLVEKLSADIKVIEPINCWNGIKARYLGRVPVAHPTKWDKNGEPIKWDVYEADRYHLSKKTSTKSYPFTICEAYAEIDANLVDAVPKGMRADWIVAELSAYAEGIQDHIKYNL